MRSTRMIPGGIARRSSICTAALALSLSACLGPFRAPLDAAEVDHVARDSTADDARDVVPEAARDDARASDVADASDASDADAPWDASDSLDDSALSDAAELPDTSVAMDASDDTDAADVRVPMDEPDASETPDASDAAADAPSCALELCSGSCVDTQSSLDHCGACGAICAFANATAQCSMGACRFDRCSAGYVDVNGSASDGCECRVSGALDPIDLAGIDENCDGVDGIRADSIYVDVTAGDDTRTGIDPSQPLRTLRAALVAAAARGRHAILLTAGTSDERASAAPIAVIAETSVHGGFDRTFRARTASSATTILGPRVAMSATGVTMATTLSNLAIVAADASVASDGASIALRVQNTGSWGGARPLSLSNVSLEAGNGAQGVDGLDGAAGAGGAMGTAGTSGASGGAGGAGGLSSCGVTGGQGGNGGASASGANPGLVGRNGAMGGATAGGVGGGGGGAGSCLGSGNSGQPGAPGSAASAPSDASGGAAALSVTDGEVRGRAGDRGNNGFAGSGGDGTRGAHGGGGAGGASGCVLTVTVRYGGATLSPAACTMGAPGAGGASMGNAGAAGPRFTVLDL